jgi:hypothetical protein
MLPKVREHHSQAEFSTWLLLRALDRENGNRGRIRWENGLAFLNQFQSQQTSYRHLARGDGTWWLIMPTATGKAIFLVGGLKMLNKLGCDLIINRVVPVPLGWFRGTVGQKRAALHAAELTHIARKPRPLSRYAISRITGVHARTQRRYCRLKNPQTGKFVVTEEKSRDFNARECYRGRWLLKQFGNTFSTPLVSIKWGKAKAWNAVDSSGWRNASATSLSGVKIRYCFKGSHAIQLARKGYFPVIFKSRLSRFRVAYWDSDPFSQICPANRVSTRKKGKRKPKAASSTTWANPKRAAHLASCMTMAGVQPHGRAAAAIRILVVSLLVGVVGVNASFGWLAVPD